MSKKEMTPKEAKAILEVYEAEILDTLWLTYEQRKGLNEALDMGIKALEQTRWIPVSERLPEKDEVVLITNKWHEVDKALYIGGEMFDIIINYLQKEDVIAWMPLPKPYEESEE